MANFFAMGGYAGYVWPAYAISFAVLIGAVVVSVQAHARARRNVRQLEDDASGTEDAE